MVRGSGGDLEYEQSVFKYGLDENQPAQININLPVNFPQAPFDLPGGANKTGVWGLAE